MGNINTELFLIIICGIVILSYLFSIISKYIRVPSVLLLLFTGIRARQVADAYHFAFQLPERAIEALGVVGLIMIVLEAGLDLKIRRTKFQLIRNSFFSALVIFVISALLITLIVYYWLHQPVINCIAYAVPLSIISSAIAIPSIHSLSERKKNSWSMKPLFQILLALLFLITSLPKKCLPSSRWPFLVVAL